MLIDSDRQAVRDRGRKRRVAEVVDEVAESDEGARPALESLRQERVSGKATVRLSHPIRIRSRPPRRMSSRESFWRTNRAGRSVATGK